MILSLLVWRHSRTNMVDDSVYTQLVEDFGLAVILEQNDIEEWEAIRFLFCNGFLDLNEYIFTELEDLGDED